MVEFRPPRIALIHALEESVAPARAAFWHLWPQARTTDLIDTSLAIDLADAGSLSHAMKQRFLTLGRYAAGLDGPGNWQADGILFTCSAFGPAIDAVKSDLPIPVYRPSEAALSRALKLGRRIGLIVTFAPSLEALSGELQVMAKLIGREISIEARLAEGALDALKAGNADLHDQIIAETARELPPIDVLLLGQFSAARAAGLIETWSPWPILTTPGCAVDELRADLDRMQRKARWIPGVRDPRHSSM